MKFLHTDFNGGPGDTVVVTLDSQANVMLLDDHCFSSYKNGRSFQYHGGWATTSPVRLRPPRTGHWHVVVDLGGSTGHVKAGIQILNSKHRVAL